MGHVKTQTDATETAEGEIKKNWNALEKLNKTLTNLNKNLVSLKIS